MREVFKEELFEAKDRLVELATLVETAITQATEAFTNSDVTLAETVIENDPAIDELAISLDELSIQILGRQQPVARDLRIVVGALRMSASLERMGDMADHIAQLTRYRFPEKAIAKGLRGTFKKMGERDVEIAGLLVELLKTQDLAIIDQMRDVDDIIDDLHLSVFDKVLGETWKGTPVDTVDATLASRYHERFADHAISIAKKVRYLATGDWVEPEN
jgi:phosphate transport system protein